MLFLPIISFSPFIILFCMLTDPHGHSFYTDALYAEQYNGHCPYEPKINEESKQKQLNGTHRKQPLGFSPGIMRNAYHNVALLRANWYGANKRLITYTFGSAVMLTKNIALTCTHNLYSLTRRRFADEVEILVGIECGFVVEHYQSTYRKSIVTKNTQNAFFENFFTGVKGEIEREKLYFEYQPKKQQLTLIALSSQNMLKWQQKGDKQDGITNGLPLGNLLDDEMVSKKQLMIVGYPSETYKQQTNIKNVLVNRKALKGYFDHIEAYHAKGKQRLEIINYTMPTSLGFSGSPILAVRDDQLIVIGIHTHRGQQEGINSGVYFDQAFLEAISEFEERIKRKLEDAGQDKDQSIRFFDEKKGPQPIMANELGYISSSDRKEKSAHSQSDHSQQSKMEDLYNSFENSQMDDLGLLDYFTLDREEPSSYQQLQSCRCVLIPSLLYSDLDGQCRLANRNQLIIQG